MPSYQGIPTPQRYGAIIAIALGIMLSVLDGSIVNLALPNITKILNTSESQSIWLITAFQLAIVMSLLSLSSLGDRIGYKKIYIAGLLGFISSSVLCALADNLIFLVIARTLQGFSAAAIMSVNTALIRQIYPAKYLGRGMAINTMVVAVSAASGPTIAASILAYASWHWLFLINIPIGVASVILAYRFLPLPAQRKPDSPFDIKSSILNAITFALFFAAISGVEHQLSWWWVLALALGCALFASCLVKRQIGLDNPLLPIDLLRIPIFSMSLATSICSFTAQMIALVSLPFYLQNNLAREVTEVGLLLTPWPIAVLIVAPIAGRLIEHVHSGLLGALGLGLFATGLACLALTDGHTSNLDFVWRIALCGAGFALFQSPNNFTIISSAPPQRSGGASGMLGTARLIGQTFGASLVAVLFNWISAPNNIYTSLWLACMLAAIGAVVSSFRLSQPRPMVN